MAKPYFEIDGEIGLAVLRSVSRNLDPFMRIAHSKIIIAAAMVYKNHVEKLLSEGKTKSGKPLKPNAVFWNNFKKSTVGKSVPLSYSGTMAKSFKMIAATGKKGQIVRASVGIPKGLKHPDSKLEVGQLAERLEAGYVQQLTPEMRKYLDRKFMIPFLGRKLSKKKKLIRVPARYFRKKALMSARKDIKTQVDWYGKEAIGLMVDVMKSGKLGKAGVDKITKQHIASIEQRAKT